MVGDYAGEGDLIQLITDDEGDDINQQDNYTSEIPILSVRNTVLFPGVVIPITVGRQRSIKLVKKAQKGDKLIGVCAQINPNNDDPSWDDIYHVGTLAKIIKMIVLPDGNTTIIIQGKKRFKITETITEDPYFTAKVDYLEETFPKNNKKIQALEESLKDAAAKILHLNPEIPREAQVALDNIDNTPFLTHFLSSNINAPVEAKQRLLEINDGVERATLLLEFMMKDIQMLELKSEIQKKVHTDIDQQQRDTCYADISRIAQGQLDWEDQARAAAPELLILDTHLLSNMLWSQTLFGDCPAWIEQALLARDYHLHLLLDPRGVPWVDDGQRCQPELAQRVAFYEQCAGWLRQHQQPLQCIKGDWRERREQTLTAVAQWLGSPHQHAGPGQQ